MSFDGGYSKRPLWKKLGIKPTIPAYVVSPPDGLTEVLSAAGAELTVLQSWEEVPREAAFVHVFSKQADVVARALPALSSRIRRDGVIWVSWPKKASKVPTDLTEDVIRRMALAGDLVDVKVCAIDAIWSGLKLMIRRERR